MESHQVAHWFISSSENAAKRWIFNLPLDVIVVYDVTELTSRHFPCRDLPIVVEYLQAQTTRMRFVNKRGNEKVEFLWLLGFLFFLNLLYYLGI